MKNALFLVCLLGILLSAQAQSLRYQHSDSSFSSRALKMIDDAAGDPGDTVEGGRLNSLTKWEYFMSSRIANDVSVNEDIWLPFYKATAAYFSAYGANCATNGYSGNWNCIGPYTNYWGSTYERAGRINSVWVHPTDTNKILVGGDAGGLVTGHLD